MSVAGELVEEVGEPRREGPMARGWGVLERGRRWVGREFWRAERHAVAEGIDGCRYRGRDDWRRADAVRRNVIADA